MASEVRMDAFKAPRSTVPSRVGETKEVSKVLNCGQVAQYLTEIASNQQPTRMGIDSSDYWGGATVSSRVGSSSH